ncbi:MAG: hypothetical protein I3274_07980 [Candidatus Moeniiplasma glomeromycotorum]|nr:hypothetical protein [Candidatus Moeniiplasma glomeromycotorum]
MVKALVLNKRLLELIKKRKLCEKEMRREFMNIWERFCIVIIGFFLSSVLCSLLRMIGKGEKTEEYSFLFSLASLALFLFIMVFLWLCVMNFYDYSKKINKIDQQIIKELEKLITDSKE